MQLEPNEYTTKTFLEYLSGKFGTKINGKDFTANDIAQYLIRGYTPHRYENIFIEVKVQEGVRIISIINPLKKKK